MTLRLARSVRPYVCSNCRQNLLNRARRRFASSSVAAPETYDVVTVGGGPVGLALLAALKSSPVTSHLRVALVESQDLSRARAWSLPPDNYSNRASSLTPTSISFLDEIGVWKHVDQIRVKDYPSMEVWDGGNDSFIQFDHQAEARKYNAPPRVVATMTENANVTKGLLTRIAELGADPSVLDSTSVSSIDHGTNDPNGLDLSSWPVVKTSSPTNKDGLTLTTRLLIGADGFNSPVRNFAGIASSGWDYNRHGLVATLTTEGPSSSSVSSSSLTSDLEDVAPLVAYQRFLPSLGGPIALLPLPNNRASLVWSTTPSNAAYMKTLQAESAIALMNAALHLDEADIQYLFTLPSSSSSTSAGAHAEELSWRFKHTARPPNAPIPPFITSLQPNTLASFPLRFRHASTYTGPRVALIGDAAHTIHPLAGQGLNLGLADAASLFRTLRHAVAHGQDLGDEATTLEAYGGDRWGKNLAMGVGVDGLEKVFALGGGGDGLISRVAGRVRGLGMDVFASSAMEGVRGWVMRRAE